MCIHTFYDQCNIFFQYNFIYVLQGVFKCLVRLGLILPRKKLQLAISGAPKIWQDHQISRAGSPMVHCQEM